MPLANLEEIKELTLAPGIRARVVNTGNMSIAHVTLDEGALLPQHAHSQEQVVNVIDGELELVVENEKHLLTRGKVMVLPPMIPHSGRAITKVYVVDTFHPVRDDFVAMEKGTPGPNPYEK